MSSNEVLAEPAATAGAKPVVNTRLGLALLTCVVLVNIVDRQLVGILAEPIKRDLQLSDTQLGLLTGLAFSMLYAVMGIPIARIADRGDRTRVIAIATAVWSAMTAACGLAPNFPLLLLARMGVAVGEAGCLPPTYSLISDYFPAGRRASAVAVLQIGAASAVFCAFFAGGIMAEALGWRATFIAIALPGLLLAALVARLLPEPRRAGFNSDASDREESLPLMQAVVELLRQSAYRHLLFGGAMASITIYTILVWTPSLFQRAYGWSISETGLILGVVFAAGGLAGALSSATLADRRFKRDRGAHGQVSSVLMLCAAPILLIGLLTRDATVTLVMVGIAQMLSNTWQPNVMGAIQGVAQPRTRALASAIAGLVINIVGLGLGPLIVGIASDLLEPRFGSQTLRYAMLTCIAAYLISSIHLHFAARRLRALRID